MPLIIPGKPPAVDSVILGPDGKPLVRVQAVNPVGPTRFQSLGEDGQPIGESFEVQIDRIAFTTEVEGGH